MRAPRNSKQNPSMKSKVPYRPLQSTIPIAAGFLILVLAGLALLGAAWTTASAERLSTHSLQVRQMLGELFSTVQDAETGQRGYLLTSNPSYLMPFTKAQASLPKIEQELRTLLGDDPEQQNRLNALAPLVEAKMAELTRTVELHQATHHDEALAVVNTNEGQNLMLNIRDVVANIDKTELALLSARSARVAFQRTLLLSLVFFAILTSGILAYLVARTGRVYADELKARNDALQIEMEQREEAQALLRQAQKMEAVGQLTGGVAHDFNNMLAVVIGNLGILIRRLPPEQTRIVAPAENALAGARRAAELTKRLLAFSRLQPLKPQRTDVNICMRDMSEMLRRTLGERIEIETVLAGGLWPARVDTSQLESAIVNLAINARDAMEGGAVSQSRPETPFSIKRMLTPISRSPPDNMS
jgi:CHASE3 domain sensor protein